MITMQPPVWNETYQCVFGGHEVDRMQMIGWLEGQAVCLNHANEILDAALERKGDVHIALEDAFKKNQRRWREEEQERAADRLRSKRKPGFVYYIRIDGLIKIGYTVDIRERTRAYPPTSELLAAHPGTTELEQQMHRQFAAFRERGREWFRPAPEVMEHIDEVREKFGDVSNLAHKYGYAK